MTLWKYPFVIALKTTVDESLDGILRLNEMLEGTALACRHMDRTGTMCPENTLDILETGA